jgi:hypothetical protein
MTVDAHYNAGLKCRMPVIDVAEILNFLQIKFKIAFNALR